MKERGKRKEERGKRKEEREKGKGNTEGLIKKDPFY